MGREIADRIKQKRYQLLIHSCIYYELNQSVISDDTWNKWANELRDLQNEYPDISKQVVLYEYFKDWDASTGAFLPITLDWVVNKASYIVELASRSKKKETTKKRLF